MANPTTNYGWPMPTATDLVTDLPADFAAFGQPVDTSLKALNPETTLCDIAYRSSTSNTNTRLGIGTTGQVLTVSAGVPAWTTVGASGLTYLTGASFTSASSVSLATNTFSATYQNYMMKITLNGVSSNTQMGYRMRASGVDTSSAIYHWSLTGFAINNTAFTNAALSETSMKPHNLTSSTDYDAGEISIYSPFAAQQTRLVAVGSFASNGGTAAVSLGSGFTPNTTSYDAMTFFPLAGTITGSYKVYGIANS
jgi:hypothetical protein